MKPRRTQPKPASGTKKPVLGPDKLPAGEMVPGLPPAGTSQKTPGIAPGAVPQMPLIPPKRKPRNPK